MKFSISVILSLLSSSYAASTGRSLNNTSAQCKPLLPETADLAATDYSQLVSAIRIPSGTFYRYIFSKPSAPERPWLLFIHGFPSTSFDWRHQVKHFVDQGYGVIAPDLLGYGGTDNPPELEQFSLKRMVEDIRELLDCEDVGQVFAVGHDFGAVVLSRVVTYMSERLLGVAFVGVGYSSPPMTFNQAGVEDANNATLEMFGYPAFGYWYFMKDDKVAPILDVYIDSAYTPDLQTINANSNQGPMI